MSTIIWWSVFHLAVCVVVNCHARARFVFSQGDSSVVTYVNKTVGKAMSRIICIATKQHDKQEQHEPKITMADEIVKKRAPREGQ